MTPCTKSRAVTATAFAVMLVAQIPATLATATSDAPTLISRSSGPSGEKGNGPSSLPSISADGRFVAFQSRATNLTPDDADLVQDVFVRDTQANSTTLVSQADGLAGPKGDGDSSEPSISPDGRFVAFTSDADNLAPGVSDQWSHVFVRDTLAGTTTAVDRAPGPAGQISNYGAESPAISADGRRVAFASPATNLDPADPDDRVGIFVRDLSTANTSLVSRASGESGEAASNTSGQPSISADGTRIAFFSFSKNLAPGGTVNPDFGAIFVRDLEAQATTLASRESGANGRVQRGTVRSPAISGDGRRVAFTADGENLSPHDRPGKADIYVRELEANNRTILASRRIPRVGRQRPGSAEVATLSSDGRRIAFSVSYSGVHGPERALMRNLKRKRPQVVKGAIVDEGFKASLFPKLSADGRWLAFQTDAATASPDDSDPALDAFISQLRQ